jgi:hypothetical protein
MWCFISEEGINYSWREKEPPSEGGKLRSLEVRELYIYVTLCRNSELI